jgi:WD40 repeat protein
VNDSSSPHAVSYPGSAVIWAVSALASLLLGGCTHAGPPPHLSQTPSRSTPSTTASSPSSIIVPTSTVSPPHAREIQNLGKGSADVVARSPDGSIYVIGGSLGLHLYDASSLEEIASYPVGIVREVTFNEDGHLLAVSTFERVIVLDIRDGSLLIDTPGIASDLTFSADGSSLTFIFHCYFDIPDCPDSIHIWSIPRSRRVFDLLSGPSDQMVYLRHVATSPDATLAAAGDRDGVVYIWDLTGGPLPAKIQAHAAPVSWVEFSPDGSILASASDDGTVRLWDTSDGASLRSTMQFSAKVDGITFSPNGRTINFHLDDGSVEERDTSTGRFLSSVAATPSPEVDARTLLRSRDGYVASISAIAYSPDGRTLAVADGNSPMIFFFDVLSGDCLGTAEVSATGLAYSHRGDWLAAPDEDGNLRILDTTEYRVLKVIQTSAPKYPYPFALSPDDDRIAVSTDQGIELWVVQTGRLSLRIETGPASFLSFSAGGDVITADTMPGFGATTWDSHNGSVLATFTSVSDKDYQEVVGLDHRTLAVFKLTGYDNNTVDLWNIDDPKLPTSLRGVNDYGNIRLAFSPDGRLAVVSFYYGITFYDSYSGGAIFTYDKTVNFAQFDFTPDGLSLALGDDYGTIIIWDISSIVAALPPKP